MRRFVKLAAILLLSGPTSGMAAEPEMQTIETFIRQNSNSKNGSLEVHVGLRCYSLFTIMAAYTENNNMAKYSKNFKDSALIFLNMAIESQITKNQSYIVDQSKIMIEAYTARFLKAKALTGNFSDDEIIAKDMAFCSSLAKGE